MKTFFLCLMLMGTMAARTQQVEFDVTCICSPDQATGAIVVETGPDLDGATWAWSGPGGFTAPFQSIYGLEDTGTYHLTAMLASGDTFQISQWVGYCMDIETSIQGGTGGAGFTISVTPHGEGPFEYAWSMFEGTMFVSLGVYQSVIGGLPPGYYTVEIRQPGNNCRVFESFTLIDDGTFLLSTCMPTSAGDGSRTVRLSTQASGRGEWLIRNAEGAVLWQEPIALQPTSPHLTIPIPHHLDPGTYALEIRQGSTTLLAAPLLR